MTNFQTQHGFNDDEVVGTLQKQIRQGIEDDALYWATHHIWLKDKK